MSCFLFSNLRDDFMTNRKLTSHWDNDDDDDDDAENGKASASDDEMDED